MIGIDPATIVPLALDAGEPSDAPSAASRFAAASAEWIEDRFGADDFDWQTHWRYAPYELLARALSREELIRLWHGAVLSSKVDDYLREHDELVWKIRNSLWCYGASTDLRRFIDCHNGLGRLRVELPGFAVRITHTSYCNTAAWAVHGRDNPIYLDASFGALLYHRGTHVLTIGFALSAHGILVAQAQLREKRGNRFLYRLPGDPLDFALDLLHRAFPGDPLHLVTGASTAAAIRAAYGKEADKLSPEVAGRVARFYDQPLRDFRRTGETVRCGSDDGRVFACLERNVDQQRAAA